MPIVDFIQRVGGALTSAAASAIIKFRPVLVFDPTSFKLEDVPDQRINGTSADPGIATGYTKVSLAPDAAPAGSVPITAEVIAGAGMTGGGAFSAGNPVLNVVSVAGTLTVTANSVETTFGPAPADVTKAAASAGVAANSARSDHKHDVSTAAASNVGTSNTEGSATSLARSDHGHNLPFATVQTVLAAASGDISINGVKITSLGTPSASTDAATKGYVDTVGAGLDAKPNCRVLATSNITLSGNQTIDGVATSTGNRAYVIGQTNPVENGIWVTAAGAWSRATDMAAGSSAEGVYAFVSEGTTNADTGWICTTNAPSDVVGTNSLAFAQFSSFPLATNAPADVTKAAAAIGTSGRSAREDHKHNVSTAAATTIGDSNTEGSATSLARSDHGHSRGNIGNANYTWGAESIAVSGTDYLYPGYSPNAADATPVSWTVAQAFRATKTRWFAEDAGTGTGTITFTLKKGVTTLLSITVNATATSGSSSPAVAIADGDNLNVEVTKTGEVLTSPSRITWTIGTTPE